MAVGFALGLGIVLGVVAGFPSGKRYALFQQQRDLAMEHWGSARKHWGGAVGPLAMCGALLVAGVLFMMFGR